MSIIRYNEFGDNMKIVGIITEYNPLHNGHLYHIEETRRLSKCDVLICVMSGNFTQRGEPALIDKFTRTKMALENKVDLVIELPFVFSVQSADMFSLTSVHLLHHLNVDEIYFGSESGNIKELENLSDLLDSDEYNSLVKQYINQGLSYPTSSDNAIKDLSDTKEYANPNNILGIQYIKAVKKLKSNIVMKTIQRQSAQYYSEHLEDTNIQSATAIRKLLKENKDVSKYVPMSVDKLLRNRKIIDFNDFTDQLKYITKSSTSEDLFDIFGTTEGLENRILKVKEFNSTDELIHKILTRRYTNSKIKRTLIHILCNSKKETLTSFDVPYVRVLGMNNVGQSYLNKIKKDMQIPLITKIKEQKHPYLETELRASKVYSLVSDMDVFKEEFKHVIIK